MKHPSLAAVCWRMQTVMKESQRDRVFDNLTYVIYPEEAVPVTGAEEAEEKPVMDEPEGKAPEEESSEEKDTLTDEQKAEPGRRVSDCRGTPDSDRLWQAQTLMNIREMPDTSAEGCDHL